MTRARLIVALAVLTALATTPAMARQRAPEPGTARAALAELRELQPRLTAHHAPETGAFDFVRAPYKAVLVRDDVSAPAEDRARAFLARYGAVVGADRDTTLVLREVATNPTTGVTHVSFDQRHDGMAVFAARVAVHMDERGIRAVNGIAVPGLDSLPATAKVSADEAADLALGTVREAARAHGTPARDLAVTAVEPIVYHTGLIDQRVGQPRLTWLIDVEGAAVSDQVFIDATDRAVLDRIERIHAARDRCVYTPIYEPSQPDLFVARAEGDGPTNIPPVDNLYDFSGQVYDLFDRAFGRDSFDGNGAKMRTVYEISQVCPNAFWRPSDQATHYCPGFDLDDVVAHEWGHAFTEHTHGLVYRNQPGALNESYSDIWGEVVDLTNGVDGIGGDNNDEPYPNGQRWLIGEDLTDAGAAALALRDMWDPERREQPSKVSSANYFCGSGDNGGVHYNSATPNHAFAMLVDGKTFNGYTIDAIGMDKASHVYYQAMVAYQTPTTGFAEHAEALAAACGDLLGVDVNSITTGTPIGSPITAADCTEVEEATLATEMAAPPVACGGPLLKPGSPDVCPGATTLLDEDWEDGLDGWTLQSTGNVPARWPGVNWVAEDDLPDGRPGTAAFAPSTGTNVNCTAPRPEHTGRFSLTSAAMTAPSDGSTVRIYLDHYVAAELGPDGGNIMLSVNDGPFTALPASAFTFNPPTQNLSAGSKSGQPAWTGSDTGELRGSWATSVATLGGLVAGGDSFRIRFEFGQNCTIAWLGWLVDDVQVVACPPVPAPAVTFGSDYENPDTDGTLTIEWTRPAGATGPEELQVAPALAPLVDDDAESGMGNWEVTQSGFAATWTTTPKAGHDSMVFAAVPNEAGIEGSTIMTLASPVSLPAGVSATLRFKDRFISEASDQIAVEVSPNGADWTPIHTQSGSNADPATQSLAYAQQPLIQREFDLAAHAGGPLHLRFRYTHGTPLWIDILRLGWWIDDIELVAIPWIDGEVSGTSHTLTGLAAGSYLARVRSTYTFGSQTAPGDWSEPVLFTVA